MLKLKGDGPVVLVDDDPDARNLARIVFKRSTVSRPVVLLESGTDLLQYLNDVGRGKAEMPAIVLLDINMPAPNGHETLHAIRAQKAFHNLPEIVMLTASNDPNDEKKAFAAGANGYQVKPFRLDDFIDFANLLVT